MRGLAGAAVAVLLVLAVCVTPQTSRVEPRDRPTPVPVEATHTPVAATPDPLDGETVGTALTFIPTPRPTPTPEPYLRWDTLEIEAASKESLLPLGIDVGAVFDADPFYTLLTDCGGPIPIRNALVAKFIPEDERFMDGDYAWRLRNDPNNPLPNVGPRLVVGFGQLAKDGHQFINWRLKAVKVDGPGNRNIPDVDYRGTISDSCHVTLH